MKVCVELELERVAEGRWYSDPELEDATEDQIVDAVISELEGFTVYPYAEDDEELAIYEVVGTVVRESESA